MDRWRVLSAAKEMPKTPVRSIQQHAASGKLSENFWDRHLENSRCGLLQNELFLKQKGWSHLRAFNVTDRWRNLRFSTNCCVKSSMPLHVNHGDPRFMHIRATNDSRSTAGFQATQEIGRKGKEQGKRSAKGVSKSKNLSDSVNPQTERSVLGNKKDDEGSSQGFAVLSTLKAQLLQISTSSETRSQYDSPGVNIQEKINSSQKSSKLSSNPYLERNWIPTIDGTNLLKKASGSETRMQPFSFKAKLQLHLSNLPDKLTTKEFDTVMRNIPGLSSWKLLVDQGGSSCGYGFCEVDSSSDGESAFALLSRMSIHGKPVIAKFPNSENPKPSDIKQSIRNNVSLSASVLFHRSNVNKEQSQILTPAAQQVIGILPHMGETQLWGVRRVSSEGVMNHSSKNLPQPLQTPGKQIAGSSSLMGESILKAMQKASAERFKSRRRMKKTSRRDKKNVRDYDGRDDYFDEELQPLIIKQEWDLELKSLEAAVAALNKFL